MMENNAPPLQGALSGLREAPGPISQGAGYAASQRSRIWSTARNGLRSHGSAPSTEEMMGAAALSGVRSAVTQTGRTNGTVTKAVNAAQNLHQGYKLAQKVKNKINPTAAAPAEAAAAEGEAAAATVAEGAAVGGEAAAAGGAAVAEGAAVAGGELAVAGGLEAAGAGLDATVVGAPVGVVLNVAGAVLGAASILGMLKHHKNKSAGGLPPGTGNTMEQGRLSTRASQKLYRY